MSGPLDGSVIHLFVLNSMGCYFLVHRVSGKADSGRGLLDDVRLDRGPVSTYSLGSTLVFLMGRLG